jgi:hypothetical protein
MADTRDKSGPNSTQPMRQIDHVNSFTALQASEMTSNHQEHDHLDSGRERSEHPTRGPAVTDSYDLTASRSQEYATSPSNAPISSPLIQPSLHINTHQPHDGESPNRPISISSSPIQSPSPEAGPSRPSIQQTPSFSTISSRDFSRHQLGGKTPSAFEIVPLERTSSKPWLNSPSSRPQKSTLYNSHGRDSVRSHEKESAPLFKINSPHPKSKTPIHGLNHEHFSRLQKENISAGECFRTLYPGSLADERIRFSVGRPKSTYYELGGEGQGIQK